MSNPIPTQSVQPRRTLNRSVGPPYLLRGTSRALARLEARTVVRLATVQAEGVVQAEKCQELDRLTREAITEQAFLQRWANHLAGSDPLLADDLRFFTDIAKLGKGEIIADTVDTYCRESRSAS